MLASERALEENAKQLEMERRLAAKKKQEEEEAARIRQKYARSLGFFFFCFLALTLEYTLCTSFLSFLLWLI
jgi:hypothetical protein